jgi:hypothetical protein
MGAGKMDDVCYNPKRLLFKPPPITPPVTALITPPVTAPFTAPVTTPTTAPIIAPTIAPVVASLPLLTECQKVECTSDSQCMEGLECSAQHHVRLRNSNVDVVSAYCMNGAVHGTCYDPNKLP